MVIVIFILIMIILGLGTYLFFMKKELRRIANFLHKMKESNSNLLLHKNFPSKEVSCLMMEINEFYQEVKEKEISFGRQNQSLKKMIMNISHDLRTPLTAIRGYLDLMENNNITEKQINYLNIIDSKVQDLTELTDQLFDFSKSIDIHNEAQRENVCINNILEDSIIGFYSFFKEYNINPKIEICEEKIFKLLNENMLKRIFENIISNAIKYSENNFNIILKEDGTIIFSNKTNLIDTTSLEKIFDRYYTVENAKKSNGIGLSIAKQLVELNNGNIQAKYENHYLIIEIKFK